jgi:uncharacterized membrane protein YfcA
MGLEIVTLVLLGLVAGTLGSLLGLGGGFLVVPVLMIWKDLDPRIATGTSIAVIVPTMLVALWRRGIQDHVDWRVAAFIAVGAVAGAFVGSWAAGRLDPLWIRRIFAVVMIGIAARMLFVR